MLGVLANSESKTVSDWSEAEVVILAPLEHWTRESVFQQNYLEKNDAYGASTLVLMSQSLECSENTRILGPGDLKELTRPLNVPLSPFP